MDLLSEQDTHFCETLENGPIDCLGMGLLFAPNTFSISLLGVEKTIRYQTIQPVDRLSCWHKKLNSLRPSKGNRSLVQTPL